MKNLLKLEQIALFAFSIFLFCHTEFAWWWFPLLLLVPDLSMIAYLGGPKLGAVVYNIVHHQALALAVLCVGWQFGNEICYFAGIILLGHSSMDRIFDYGLKYPDAFKHTHLGWIGKSA